MKVGFIAIMGRPNAGKSTLLNALLSKKVSIVSNKAQTTRDHIYGILTEKDKQYVFIDTPGIYKGGEELGRYMRNEAYSSSKDAEAILYLIDSKQKDISEDIDIIKSIRHSCPLFILLNKISICHVEEVLPKKEQLEEAFPDYKILEVSILENFGIRDIKDLLDNCLIDSPAPFFPPEMITDKDKSFQAKEAIRQKLLHFLDQEIPHRAAVKIDSLEEIKGGYAIKATIAVEKENHKAIVIGKGGSMIKKISMASRNDLEKMWHKRVLSLEIKVAVAKSWQNDPKLLSEFGYGKE